jgi:hypothetical protein
MSFDIESEFSKVVKKVQASRHIRVKYGGSMLPQESVSTKSENKSHRKVTFSLAPE